jgi:hypothetical protein
LTVKNVAVEVWVVGKASDPGSFDHGRPIGLGSTATVDVWTVMLILRTMLCEVGIKLLIDDPVKTAGLARNGVGLPEIRGGEVKYPIIVRLRFSGSVITLLEVRNGTDGDARSLGGARGELEARGVTIGGVTLRVKLLELLTISVDEPLKKSWLPTAEVVGLCWECM